MRVDSTSTLLSAEPQNAMQKQSGTVVQIRRVCAGGLERRRRLLSARRHRVCGTVSALGFVCRLADGQFGPAMLSDGTVGIATHLCTLRRRARLMRGRSARRMLSYGRASAAITKWQRAPRGPRKSLSPSWKMDRRDAGADKKGGDELPDRVKPMFEAAFADGRGRTGRRYRRGMRGEKRRACFGGVLTLLLPSCDWMCKYERSTPVPECRASAKDKGALCVVNTAGTY
ncbi:hypothetical protein DFH11DRAFT_1614215 [Phellopilus nigrolimitatus]|nr:hypothetical protein DFH11DRAFT_1614215 [Phellopilus nigrolimitatus]